MGIINSIWQTLLLLSMLVVIHEFGHFITARLFGVKVYEFSVGFGPLIGKIERNGIQYSLRWVLMGGFCKIAGMDNALEGEAGEVLDPKESFNCLDLWKKVVVIIAGPTCNLILAVILVFATAAFVGLPSNLRDDLPIVEQAIPGTPAFDAGLRPGDRITSINGEKVVKWQDISRIVSESDGKRLVVDFLRDGQSMTRDMIPYYNELDGRYIIGINAVIDFQRTSIGEAAKIGLHFPWSFTKAVVKSFEIMFSGKAGGAGLMGPIGMISVVEQNANLPLYYNLFLAIQISMFLFLFNMLPLPLPFLDGGWVVILLMERLIGREFTENQKAVAQLVGITAVMLLGVYIAYGDAIRFFKRFFGG